MALEKLHGTQLVTWLPPLPQRAFRITSAGYTSEDTFISGLSTDGKRYMYFLLDTDQWTMAEGFHQPPVQAGEQFQLWTSFTSQLPFIQPPMFAVGNAIPGQTLIGETAGATGAPDLFSVYPMTITREQNGGVAPYVLKDPTVCTIAAVQQANSGSWYVYFSPALNTAITPQQDGLVTIPQLRNPKYLGQLGHVSKINYTYTVPGGCDQLTCTLQIPPDSRSDAVNHGRILTAHRGSSCIWEGQLTSSVPTPTGWNLTANGVGTYGTNFGAWWQAGLGPTSGSSGWFPDGPVDFAIARGLRWVNRGIGRPAGIYTGPTQDAGSMTVTDFMNLLCTGGNYTWELVQPASASRWPPGPWELTVYPIPTDQSGNPLQAGPPQKVQIGVINGGKWKRFDLILSKPRKPPDLFLINTNPVARTIANDYNTIILKYEATPDIPATSTKKAQAATFAETFVDIPGSVSIHGRLEFYLDVTNAGAMTQAAAQAIGKNVLNKYVRANFATPFNVQPGQLVTPGGVPVDLGLNWAGQICSLQVRGEAAGGEVGFAPLTFMIGNYVYDDDTQTATVTPYQNARTDIQSVIASLYPGKFA